MNLAQQLKLHLACVAFKMYCNGTCMQTIMKKSGRPLELFHYMQKWGVSDLITQKLSDFEREIFMSFIEKLILLEDYNEMTKYIRSLN